MEPTTENEVSPYDAIYREFARLYGNAQPLRNRMELVAAVHASGLDPKEVSRSWLRSLNADWVYCKAIFPFADQSTNELYQKLLLGMSGGR